MTSTYISMLLFVVASACMAQESAISPKALHRLFPDLKSPVVMTLNDLPSSKDRKAFKEFGYEFVLFGDFNLDGDRDAAIVGKFINKINSEDQTFVAVLTSRKGSWVVNYFLRPKSRIIGLRRVPHPDREKERKGYRAILAQFTAEPSDDYGVIFWDAVSYKIKSGLDITAEAIESIK